LSSVPGAATNAKLCSKRGQASLNLPAFISLRAWRKSRSARLVSARATNESVSESAAAPAATRSLETT
jgi:hypothetical protein